MIAIRGIKKGEEITKDYSLIAIDQMIGNPENYWKMKCDCGSEKCRKLIHNFFKLPRKIQKEKLQFLPSWVKRKFRYKLMKIGNLVEFH